MSWQHFLAGWRRVWPAALLTILGTVGSLGVTGCTTPRRALAMERVEHSKRRLNAEETSRWVSTVLPYAYMSELAYQSNRFNRFNGERARRQGVLNNELAMAGWLRMTNRTDPSFLDPESPGLHFDVWENWTLPQPQVVVAFRGTEANDRLDWAANSRWALPFHRKHDQYEQSRQAVFEILGRMQIAARSNVLLITTGHSLGAGLSQGLFYSSYLPESPYRATQCYAFDPSPVTGALQYGTRQQRVAARAARNATQKRMAGDRIPGQSCLLHHQFGIVRAYEHGEVLHFLRWPLRQVFPLHPLITELRLNFEERGNPLNQHSMSGLAWDLYRCTDSRGGETVSVDASR